MYLFAFGAACLILWLFLRAIAPATAIVGDRSGFFCNLALAMGVISVSLVVLALPVWLRRLKRRDRQMDWAIERVRGSHG